MSKQEKKGLPEFFPRRNKYSLNATGKIYI